MSKRQLIVVGLIGLADVARGATVVTPTLFPGTASKTICIVTNVSNAPIDVKLEIVGAFSTIVEAQTSGTLGAGLTNFTEDPTPVPSYCRATGASSKKIRVTQCMATSADNCFSVVTAP